ncbi:PilW family protein [Alkalibacterium sp. MB6]|uniref:PilW family protein n=1 Tax=Alkalibacterium sp. MB6 TaxID=2081965 RepID=UPI00137AECE5|nr:prepilin-type N-terminal cleavage/methylation domain-containing protein [Alkalibacterium sp. MB6]
MKRYLKKEDGITLIELLASITILSVVILLVGSVHLFGQRQFVSQTESNRQANDLRYSLAMISRDVRSANDFELVASHHIVVDEVSYKKEGSTLLRNGSILSNRVGQFEVVPSKDQTDTYVITIASSSNDLNQSERYSTTIYLRRGSNVQATEE